MAMMKKRHEQKLVLISFVLFFLFNVPFLLIYNIDDAIWGIPVLYFSIFSIWLASVVISMIILKKFYE